jgi:polysaccharide export outer membrane protein
MPYGTSSVTLPNMPVDAAGNITVPFAGRVHVAGLTPPQIQSAVERRFSGKAIKPQIVASVVKNVTNVVTVTGAVKAPGRYNLTAASETLLQMIALAGGPTEAPRDTVVQLTRGRHKVKFRLTELTARPAEDVHARPGDYLDLSIDPRVYLIYGAVGRPGSFPLKTSDVTLADAIAAARGILDRQADSRGVFVFRYEPPEVLRSIPADAVVAGTPLTAPGAAAPLVPVIFKIDLKTASGIFYSTQFRLHDHDLIFVPTARSVDWQKYLDLLRTTASPVVTGAQVGARY